MAKRVKIGDLFQVALNDGYGYIQYIYNDLEYGYLIRGITGCQTTFAEEAFDLAVKPSKFYTFYPLQSAVNSTEKNETTQSGFPIALSYMGNFVVREDDTRVELIEGAQGNWSVRINGEKKYLGKSLPKKFAGHSTVGIVNHEALIRKIMES